MLQDRRHIFCTKGEAHCIARSIAVSTRIAFTGTHVFAGIRQLVEEGIIDGEKMPGWMTGEAAVTIGAVREGRIRAKDGVPGT